MIRQSHGTAVWKAFGAEERHTTVIIGDDKEHNSGRMCCMERKL